MSPTPTAARQQHLEARARELLDGARGAATPEWTAPMRAELFGAIREDVAVTRGRAQRVISVCACAAAFVAGIWVASGGLARPGSTDARNEASTSVTSSSPTAHASPFDSDVAPDSKWERLELSEVGLIEARGSVAYHVQELAAERQIHVDSGVLRAQITRQDPLRPLVIVSPTLRVVVVGTRFDVFVDGALTRVSVIEGHVRVESAASTVELGAGESVRSDDARLAPKITPPSAPRAAHAPILRETSSFEAPAPRLSVEACSRRESLADRQDCLLGLSREKNLAGENALVALAALARDEQREPERALEYWRLYDARFPAGSLGPEVALNRFELLVRLQRTEEAIQAALQFEARFADDPRFADVALEHGRLLCGPAGERALGRLLLDRLAATVDDSLRDRISAVAAHCDGPSLGPPGAGGLVPRDLMPQAPSD